MSDLIEELISNGWTREEAEDIAGYLRDYNGNGKKELWNIINLYLAFKESKK